MNEKSDRELDELMARHLGACLDGQLGRAAAAFRTELSPRPRPWRLWLPAGAAVAAGLAVAWVNFHARTGKITGRPTDVLISTVAPRPVTPVMESATWSRVIDDGTGMVDDRPVRRLRRKIVEAVEWYDATDRATVRTTIPRQQIFLIDMKTD